jgi:membrane-associated phospholipid phosphatase
MNQIKLSLISVTRIFLTILLITSFSKNISAQTESELPSGLSAVSVGRDSSAVVDSLRSTMPKWYEMITNIPSDLSKYFKVTFQTNKIPLYLTVSALTAATIATDRASYEGTHKFHTSGNWNTKFDEFWTEFGDGRTQFAMAFGFAGYGLLADDARAVRTGSQIVQAVIASGAVVQVLKHVTGRQTPNTATTATGTWTFFPNQIDYANHVSSYDAFPSGHVTTTLAAVTVIAENYPEVWWIKPLGYTCTALVAYGMVGTGIHWYSDYPLAVVLGYTFGMIAAHPEGIPAQIAGKEINIIPTIVNNGVGLSVGYNF